jgi:hypothetical protein
MTKSEFLSLKAGDLIKTPNVEWDDGHTINNYYMVLGIQEIQKHLLSNSQSIKCYILDLYSFGFSETVQYNSVHSNIWRAFACLHI